MFRRYVMPCSIVWEIKRHETITQYKFVISIDCFALIYCCLYVFLCPRCFNIYIIIVYNISYDYDYIVHLILLQIQHQQQ